jgi:predicted DNA-binding transcriptional regulator AlpA
MTHAPGGFEMDDCCTYSLAEVGVRLGRSRAWMYANLAKLQRAGFPEALPIVGRWSRAGIDAWIEAQGRMGAAVRQHTVKGGLSAAFGT